MDGPHLLIAPSVALLSVSSKWRRRPTRKWMSYKGTSSDNIKGLILALSSSFFIGASFIVKKKGLKKAGASGIRVGNTPN
ncbi:hypothetical protein MRB53_024366 [Persea americana]|uniref:Uncharacterized protein n=1 Tax=Persea americana TaxID=3435 RepID=A0ACC2LCJ7_PERAE|nr:hypothetical protein MRB53_024366 [Persea americana]